MTDFKGAVSDLGDVKLVENGTSDLTAAVDRVESSGRDLVADAKSDFASETTALEGSLTALGETSKQLADPQTRRAALAAVPAEIQGVKASFESLATAVKTKCD